MTYTDLIKSADAMMVEFFATWCPHCQRMIPVVPTFIVYRKGVEIWRQSGEMEGDYLLSQIEKAL